MAEFMASYFEELQLFTEKVPWLHPVDLSVPRSLDVSFIFSGGSFTLDVAPKFLLGVYYSEL